MTNASILKRVMVTAIRNETADAKTFVLEPLDQWEASHEAGQFLTLVFNTSRGEKRRSYSISSSSAMQEPLSITVKKIDNGEFSRQLVYRTQVGDVLDTTGISGFFTLPPSPHTFREFVFLAAGSGITPCYSLIKTLLATTAHSVVLIYSNKSEADTIFGEDLRRLQETYKDRFRIRFLYSNHFSVYHSRLSKWLLLQLLDEYLTEDRTRHVAFYICGPFDYMLTVRITLLGESVPVAHLFREDFSTLPRLSLPQPPDKEPHTVTVHLNGQQHVLAVQYPQSILKAAKAQGLMLPYSCEAGRCGSCIATCTKGHVWMAYNEVLTDHETSKGRILICQAFPVGGDAEIAFPD